ncbi:MAG: hypothetical protein EZS28_007586 [Streblomastix strix]|uniref:C2 domain-containing protein n=1 Tax=Streblomastix strix TaxID=222440 RepID=A0A5J4WS22_9EUKA|nr:MAG: hypothetical protein EZS28_007586 [Streblomastix strix]
MNIGGSADPFVIVSIGGQSNKTEVVHNSLNADFDQEFVLQFDPQLTQDRELKVEIWDRDEYSQDDMVGFVMIPILPYFNNETELRENIENGNEKEGLGKVLFTDEQTLIDGEYISGKLRVRVISANDLQEDTLLGKPNPYVVLRLGGKEKKRTKAINRTLNAEYNEEFTLLFDLKENQQKVLKVELWNEIQKSEDRFIGWAQIDILPYLEKYSLATVQLMKRSTFEQDIVGCFIFINIIHFKIKPENDVPIR